MNYDFDKRIDRKENNAVKWEKCSETKMLPMWVADMDFETAPEILEAMQKKLDQKIFGYTSRPDSYFESAVKWTEEIHGFNMEVCKLAHSPGVVPSLSMLIRLLTDPGDKVIVQAPVYPPFFRVVEKNNRKLLINNLIEEDGIYKIDFQDFEEKAKDEKTKFFILCNPHNPVGRVWRREELERLADICIRNNVRILSDDIWRDIVHKGNKYIPISSLSKEAEDITITCFSATKTFNIAGLQGSFVYFPRQKEQTKFNNELEILGIRESTPFNLVAIETAFREGKNWYATLLDYLEENINFTEEYIRKNLPEVTFQKPEGTYLLWLDFRKLDITKNQLEDLIKTKAGVVLNSGYSFSEDCGLFQRINIACPRYLLEEGLERLTKIVKK
ncbi:MalY/PatB family protein [Sebaldella sp. S0638]|uniref:MalY/PatB family protein n=1 Tax=Sebaldella sp. S0638 TaxID=2957809 RepID=UPI00209F3E79|nr:MalY/PatB family protein [Sebaldella sp. S0638]MCP1225434.1 pyridoxal phosphate-dependent aminotransferase [Sebaldella sp. S0638]